MTLNTPVTTQNCTNNFNIFVDFQLDSYCSNTGQMYVNVLLEDSRCSQINFNTAKSIVDTCSIKADGELDDFALHQKMSSTASMFHY